MDGKKRHKMIAEPPWNPQVVTQGGWVSTMAGTTGRVRKGNPSNFVQTLDMISETPARGGGFKKLRLQPPRELVVTAVQLCTCIYCTD